jgi:hypothetical protein
VKLIALRAIVLFVVAGCATSNPISTPPYYPSNPSAVLLTHEGEIQASGIVSTGGETFLAAYAFTPHLGLLVDGSIALHKSGDPNGNQYSGEIGAGFFDTGITNHFRSEIYGAIGWGSARDDITSYLYNIIFEDQEISGEEQIRFWNAWVQGATGYSKGNFSLMMLLRFEYVGLYHDLTQASVNNPYLWYGYPSHYDTTIAHSNDLFLLTPALEVRYGFEHIQLIAAIFVPLLDADLNNNNIHSLESLGICYKF